MSSEAVPAAGRRGPALLHPLRHRDFRLVFAGETISQFGDQFHFIALAWLALALTGSGLALGTVLLVAGVPRAVFMLVGGAFSDRMSPRTLMLVSNVLRSVLVAGLTVLVFADAAQLWHLYVVALAFGVVDAFFWPAFNTFVPMAVGADELPAANGLVQGGQTLTQLLGPIIGGIVVAAAGMAWAFGVDATSFAVAALALLLVSAGRRTPPPDGEPRPSMLAEINDGLRYVWRDRAVRSLVILSMALNFAFTGPLSVGLPFLAREQFAGGAAALGLVFSAFGGGALIGALIAGSIGRVRELGWLTLSIAAVMGVLLSGLGLSGRVAVVAGLMLVIGLGVGVVNVLVVAWIQRRTPQALLGRTMSVVSLGSVGLAPVSMAIAGAVADLWAAAAVFAVAGATVVASALAGIAWDLPAGMRDG